MITNSLTDKLCKTDEGMKLYQQERAILDVTELICEVMQELDISRSELAQRIGKTKGYITQMLDGSTNMTIRTISDVFTALDRAIFFHEAPIHSTINTDSMISLHADIEWQQQENSFRTQQSIWNTAEISYKRPYDCTLKLAG